MPVTTTILVIEDEDAIGEILRRLLGPIKERYPGAEIVWVKTMEEARVNLRTMPLPALIVADLLLPDSTFEESIATVRTIHPFSPSVIFTGHSVKEAQKKLRSDADEIAVIEKGDDGWIPKLFAAMCRALQMRATRDKRDTFAELRVIIAGLKEKGYGSSETPTPRPL